MKGAMSERQMGLGIAPIYKNLGSFGFGISVLDGFLGGFGYASIFRTERARRSPVQ